MQNIVITSKSTICALGHDAESIWAGYKDDETALTMCCYGGQDTPVGKLSPVSEEQIKDIRKSNLNYRRLDKSVLLSLWASRKVVESAGWNDLSNVGVNIGSSRGATQLFEKYHRYFVESPDSRMTPLVSPTTTLGNIASWVAYDLGVTGATLSHSITCSTALYGMLNACAWLKSGMADKFIVGGAEAPLTDFTVAQMRSLGVYSTATNKFEGDSVSWPSAPLLADKDVNTMVLGEGASVFALEVDNGQPALAKIAGLGYGTEIIEHNASLSAEAECMQKSMRMALENAGLDSVDVVIMHAPGTHQGDTSELRAVKTVFGGNSGKNLPHLVSTKHMTGHTLGASGGVSLDLALEILQRGEVIHLPYETEFQERHGRQLGQAPQTVLVNAVGFGGNAVSVIVSKL
jgi:3-oxoacyl-(acyl-carrier-protein) synthase